MGLLRPEPEELTPPDDRPAKRKRRTRPTLQQWAELTAKCERLARTVDLAVRVVEANIAGADYGLPDPPEDVSVEYGRGLLRGRAEGLRIALVSLKRITSGGPP